ncbi:MAG: aspartate/glutamate racemase family protein [Pseudomonadota bacterium]
MTGPILVINPNSNQAVTDGLDRALAPFRAAGPAIECLTLAEGPFGIESQRDSDAVIGPLAALVAARGDASAHVIACYSDPGLETCREIAAAPVFGIQDCAILTALARADRIGIIGLSAAAALRHRRYMRRMGVLDRVVGERAVDLSVADSATGADTPDRLAEAGAALMRDGAEAIVLGCAGMAPHCAALERRLGVPVIEPVMSAVAMALGTVLAAGG